MTSELAIIARCTRDGVTSWQQVAKQLGVSVETARRQYDPHYNSRQDPQQLAEPDPALLPDALAYKSPHPKGDGLKAALLCAMEKHGRLATDALAAMTTSTTDSVRRRLNDLLAAGLIEHDGALPRTWALTAPGRAIARTYRDRPGRIGHGTQTGGDVAA